MTHEPSTIQSVYAQRIAADLESNRSTQGDINRQITELQTRLNQLREDEKWLSEIQGSVPPSDTTTDTAPSPIAAAPTTAPDVAETPEAAAAAVPQPRHDDALEPAPAKRAAARKSPSRKRPAKKATATKATTAKATTAKTVTRQAKTSPAKRTAKKATAVARTAPAKQSVPQQGEPAAETAKTPGAPAITAPAKKAAQPPLRELVEAILGRHAGEPRMVNEVRAELEAAHPERSTSAQVVRNALESLAKKGLVSKGTQQGSVMYTRPAPSASDADPAPATDPATASADDTKVPASA
ncbi:hypothetical protein ACGFZH_22265 [Streptomyces zaomyceticus]|uniref:hypothetical protein n=1 Tax=Streptomyces zaomyceticus TaxID=68286 RepID=UPI003712FD96